MTLTGQDIGVNSEYKRQSTHPPRQVSETSGRHKDHDKQPDCTVVTDELSTTTGNIYNPRHQV